MFCKLLNVVDECAGRALRKGSHGFISAHHVAMHGGADSNLAPSPLVAPSFPSRYPDVRAGRIRRQGPHGPSIAHYANVHGIYHSSLAPPPSFPVSRCARWAHTAPRAPWPKHCSLRECARHLSQQSCPSPFLPGIQVCALGVYGSKDKMAQDALRLVKLFEKAWSVVIPDAGHRSYEDKPDAWHKVGGRGGEGAGHDGEQGSRGEGGARRRGQGGATSRRVAQVRREAGRGVR